MPARVGKTADPTAADTAVSGVTAAGWGEGIRRICAHGRGICIVLGACLGFLGATVAIYHADLVLGLVLVLAGCAAVLALASAAMSFANLQRVAKGVSPHGAAGAESADAARVERIPDDSTLSSMIDELAIDNQLTPREREVLMLLVRGRDVRHISDALFVSVNTVRTHVQNVYTKLGVHSRQELIDFVEDCRSDMASSEAENEVFETLALA